MNLAGMKLLMLIGDGVDQHEFDVIKSGFEAASVEVVTASPQEYLAIETSDNGGLGRDVISELPLSSVEAEHYDGLIIPDGIACASMLRHEPEVRVLVQRFCELRKPVFASGRAADVLYDSGVVPPPVFIREQAPIEVFVDQALLVMQDNTSTVQAYGDNPWYFPYQHHATAKKQEV